MKIFRYLLLISRACNILCQPHFSHVQFNIPQFVIEITAQKQEIVLQIPTIYILNYPCFPIENIKNYYILFLSVQMSYNYHFPRSRLISINLLHHELSSAKQCTRVDLKLVWHLYFAYKFHFATRPRFNRRITK